MRNSVLGRPTSEFPQITDDVRKHAIDVSAKITANFDGIWLQGTGFFVDEKTLITSALLLNKTNTKDFKIRSLNDVSTEYSIANRQFTEGDLCILTIKETYNGAVANFDENAILERNMPIVTTDLYNEHGGLIHNAKGAYSEGDFNSLTHDGIIHNPQTYYGSPFDEGYGMLIDLTDGFNIMSNTFGAPVMNANGNVISVLKASSIQIKNRGAGCTHGELQECLTWV